MKYLYLVKWRDAFGCGSDWTPLDEIEIADYIISTVGWKVTEDDNYIVIVPHLYETSGSVISQGCGEMTIPKSAIISTSLLNEREVVAYG